MPAIAPFDNGAPLPLACVDVGLPVAVVLLGVLDTDKKTLLDASSALSLAGKRSAFGHDPFAQGLLSQHPMNGGLFSLHVYQRALPPPAQSCGGMWSNLSAEKEELRRSALGQDPEPSAQGFLVQHPRNSTLLSSQM